MNAERLHALALRIKDELERTNAVDTVAGIAAALQRVMQQQPTAQGQQQLANTINEFRNGMQQSEIAEWSPAWIELLREIGQDDLLGEQLRIGVDEIITRNEITPAIAKEEVDKLNRDAASGSSGAPGFCSR
jgi:hypothetical protein